MEEIDPQEVEGSENPQIQSEEEIEGPVLIASEEENIPSSRDFDKWKLQQEFKLEK